MQQDVGMQCLILTHVRQDILILVDNTEVSQSVEKSCQHILKILIGELQTHFKCSQQSIMDQICDYVELFSSKCCCFFLKGVQKSPQIQIIHRKFSLKSSLRRPSLLTSMKRSQTRTEGKKTLLPVNSSGN